jgi:hypothetical protein
MIVDGPRVAGPYLTNGSQTVFPFDFKVLDRDDIRVVRTELSGGEAYNLVFNTEYTVSLNTDQDNNPGGTITTTTTLPSGHRLTLTSDAEIEQPVVFTNTGGFYPSVLNDSLDRLTIIAQQLRVDVDRAFKVPLGSEAIDAVDLSDADGKVLAVIDGEIVPIENDLATAVDAAEAAENARDEAEAEKDLARAQRLLAEAAEDGAEDARDDAEAAVTAAEGFRDQTEAIKADAEDLLTDVSSALAAGTISDLVGTRIYTSRAALEADLVPADNEYALVVGDATPENNDLYQKNGATTTGSWDGPLGIFASASSAAQEAADEAAASAALIDAYQADIYGLAWLRVWNDGLVADGELIGGLYTTDRPLPDAWDYTPTDLVRYHDQLGLDPAPNAEPGVFFNSSANWSNPSTASGVRLPVGVWTGTKVLAVAKGFLSGTSDTDPSVVLYNTIEIDGDDITPGVAGVLVTDSTAVNKINNATLVYNPVLGVTFCLFCRDDREGTTDELFELVTEDEGATWRAGVSGPAFTIGSGSANARTISGVLDPAADRTYFSPHPGICDDAGTMYVSMWEDTDLSGASAYRIVVLKRAVGDSEWSRLWSLSQGPDTGLNEDTLNGEHSLAFTSTGNILIVNRGNSAARPWWEITPAGALVDNGDYAGQLSTVDIGMGFAKVGPRLLAIGPEISTGGGLNDLGMHLKVSYDDGATWLGGVLWEQYAEPYHFSADGQALPAPILSTRRSGNSALVPIDGDRALALIERAGPTGAGTAANYTMIGARLLNPVNAVRNASRGGN